ncbi:MAG: peptide chain release factor 3, partial [Xanthomonadaceae bacterium]|nr:peptide chain release factor 3 [Xanthomonadaceae bacterium]
PLELLDEVESVLQIECAPVTWPIGMGKSFRGVYHLLRDEILLFAAGNERADQQFEVVKGIDNPRLVAMFPHEIEQLKTEVELVHGASHQFDLEAYLAGTQTPVFFGSAINNFGVREILNALIEWAPAPRERDATVRAVAPAEPHFSGFVFKIQANMDPAHRDRVAFLRVCSGNYKSGMKALHVRTGKEVKLANALTFMASEREIAETAWPGDVIGLHNHGTISIGDSFSEGEKLVFTGIPNFAPELFRRAHLRDPLKMKALRAGLAQLSEEGATQFFRPLMSNDLILGAVGVLQFDVAAYRLKDEYNVDCAFENVGVVTARWVHCDDAKKLADFRERNAMHLAIDAAEQLVYLAPTRVNLQLAQERWPDVTFTDTREVANATVT